MSVITGIASGKFRVLCADTQSTYSDGHKEQEPKIYRFATGLFGFAGDAKPEQELKAILRKQDTPEDVAHWPKGNYSCIFFSRTGACYSIGEEGALRWEKSISFRSMGSGYQYATGAVFAACKTLRWNIRRLPKRKLVYLAKLSVKSAIHYNESCGGRAQVKTLEL